MFNFNQSRLMQLIYMSTPVDGTTQESLVSVVSKAQAYNLAHEISGFLLFDGQHVLQLLEGPKREVMALFEKIKNDDRHHHVQALYEEVSEERAMPFLGMGLSFINSKENLKHDFYYTRIQAQEFSGLIEGAVGNFFRKYLF